jgi:hypothetical protein
MGVNITRAIEKAEDSPGRGYTYYRGKLEIQDGTVLRRY